MFIAIGVEKGAVYIEGKTMIPTADGKEKLIENWDDIPTGVEIAAVTLTDNAKMSFTMSGCKRYVVYREAVTSVGGIPSAKKPPTQVLVGVKDYTADIRLVREGAAQLRSELGERNSSVISNGLNLLKRVEEEIVQKYRDSANQVVRLGFDFGVNGDHKQAEKGFRDGVPSAEADTTAEAVRVELLKRTERYSKHG